MDYSFAEKPLVDTIEIAIVYDNTDYKNAQKLQRYIDEKYKDGLNSRAIHIHLINYKNIQYNKKGINLYYLLPSNHKNTIKAINIAKKTNAITFSYTKDDLKSGVMSSLVIGYTVKPILNLKAIKLSGITFKPVLLDISEIYVNKNGVKYEN